MDASLEIFWGRLFKTVTPFKKPIRMTAVRPSGMENESCDIWHSVDYTVDTVIKYYSFRETQIKDLINFFLQQLF